MRSKAATGTTSPQSNLKQQPKQLVEPQHDELYIRLARRLAEDTKDSRTDSPAVSAQRTDSPAVSAQPLFDDFHNPLVFGEAEPSERSATGPEQGVRRKVCSVSCCSPCVVLFLTST